MLFSLNELKPITDILIPALKQFNGDIKTKLKYVRFIKNFVSKTEDAIALREEHSLKYLAESNIFILGLINEYIPQDEKIDAEGKEIPIYLTKNNQQHFNEIYINKLNNNPELLQKFTDFNNNNVFVKAINESNTTALIELTIDDFICIDDLIDIKLNVEVLMQIDGLRDKAKQDIVKVMKIKKGKK